MTTLTLGEALKAARKRRLWPREVLAEKANVSTHTISRIERGGHVGSDWTLHQLDLALGGELVRTWQEKA